MKLRYLARSADGPVLLLADADPTSARSLQVALSLLADGHSAPVQIHALPCIQAIDHCQFVAVLTDASIDSSSGECFFWRLKPVQWESVVGLLEPFATASEPVGHRHQFLGKADRASIIVSTSDHW